MRCAVICRVWTLNSTFGQWLIVMWDIDNIIGNVVWILAYFLENGHLVSVKLAAIAHVSLARTGLWTCIFHEFQWWKLNAISSSCCVTQFKFRLLHKMKSCFYVSVWCHTEYSVLIIYWGCLCVKAVYSVIICHENLEISWNLRAAREMAEY